MTFNIKQPLTKIEIDLNQKKLNTIIWSLIATLVITISLMNPLKEFLSPFTILIVLCVICYFIIAFVNKYNSFISLEDKECEKLNELCNENKQILKYVKTVNKTNRNFYKAELEFLTSIHEKEIIKKRFNELKKVNHKLYAR